MMLFNSRNRVVGYCFITVVAAVLAAAGAGCDDQGGGGGGATQSQPQVQPQAAAAEPLPAGLVLPEAPAGAKDVAAAKKEAKEGDQVVLRGRVGGSVSPFVEGRASFQLVDASMRSCKDIPGDTCATPWDYCCDDAKEVANHSASVQVVGADGRPLRAGLQGVGGLKPLSEVTVKGTVAKAGGAGPLVVNATGIHVKG